MTSNEDPLGVLADILRADGRGRPPVKVACPEDSPMGGCPQDTIGYFQKNVKQGGGG